MAIAAAFHAYQPAFRPARSAQFRTVGDANAVSGCFGGNHRAESGFGDVRDVWQWTTAAGRRGARIYRDSADFSAGGFGIGENRRPHFTGGSGFDAASADVAGGSGDLRDDWRAVAADRSAASIFASLYRLVPGFAAGHRWIAAADLEFWLCAGVRVAETGAADWRGNSRIRDIFRTGWVAELATHRCVVERAALAALRGDSAVSVALLFCGRGGAGAGTVAGRAGQTLRRVSAAATGNFSGVHAGLLRAGERTGTAGDPFRISRDIFHTAKAGK